MCFSVINNVANPIICRLSCKVHLDMSLCKCFGKDVTIEMHDGKIYGKLDIELKRFLGLQSTQIPMYIFLASL